MRPAREFIIGKSGEETIRFNPTAHQILFAIEKAKTPEESDYAIATRIGISPSNPVKWGQKYGSLYLEWLEEFVENASFGKEADVLEAVGMIHAAQGSYNFWKDMAKKHGVIADEPKDMRITINTNFDIIYSQGDLTDARRKLLQEVRGLGNQGESGVVDVTPTKNSRSPEGPGNRASDVQGGPLALAAPLGSDGGQSERGSPVPAVSKRHPPAGINGILGKKKVPPSPKK